MSWKSFMHVLVLVPHDHVVATMIDRDVHNLAHVAREWILSIVRRTYWITNARLIIRRVSKGCVSCKGLFGKGHHK